MGRVRRYKKLKACDPCAPKRGRGDDDDKYDLPVVDSDDEGESIGLVCGAVTEGAGRRLTARDTDSSMNDHV